MTDSICVINTDNYPSMALISVSLSWFNAFGGSRIFVLIIKSPRDPGDFEIGIPRPITTSVLDRFSSLDATKLLSGLILQL